MPLYHPPADLVRELRAYDPALRLRWSDAQQVWRLERKVSRGRQWPPSIQETPAGYESRVAARDGYVLVDLIPHRFLDKRLLLALQQRDLWRHGGAARVADEMDRLDAEAQAAARARVGDLFETMARERCRYMNTVRTVPERFAHTAAPGGMSIND